MEEDTRYLTIPSPADITIPLNPPITWSAPACYRHIVENDQRFNSSGAGIRASIRLLTAIKADLAAGDIAELKDGDWKMLREAMEAPSCGYLPIMHQIIGDKPVLFTIPLGRMIGYIDALSDKATRDKPIKTEAKAANVAEANALPAAQAS